MFTVVCGEDLVSSREYFVKLKQEYKNKNFEIANLQFGDLLELNKWQSSSLSLFNEKKVYFIENINKKINRRSIQQKKILDFLINNKNIIIVDWEESVPSRYIKITKGVIIKEFKPSQTIFKLVESCYPGNLNFFLNQLHNLPDKTEDGFIFYMLTKNIRNLLLLKSNTKPAKMLDWQYWKLQKQAKFWSLEKLISFYEGLQRIDAITKTGKNPFSICHSLDILAYYLL